MESDQIGVKKIKNQQDAHLDFLDRLFSSFQYQVHRSWTKGILLGGRGMACIVLAAQVNLRRYKKLQYIQYV